MDKSLPTDEQLLAYLDNELTIQEKEKIGKLIQNNPELQEKIQKLELTISGIYLSQTAKKINIIHAEMMSELSEQKVISFKQNFKWKRLIAVAASFLIIVATAALLWANSLKPDQLIESHFVDYTVASTRSDQQSLSPAKLNYTQNNFDKVIAQNNSTSLTAEDSLLIGLAYMKLNRTNQAADWFRNSTAPDTEYKDDAEYYLSMTYIESKQFDKALDLLKRIYKNPNHLYKEYVSKQLLFKLTVLKYFN